MTDSETLDQVRNHFILTHPGQVSFYVPFQSMLDTWHSLRGTHTSVSDIVNYYKAHGIDADTAGTFAAAMKQIDAGIPIQDPNEDPSLSEIVDGYTSRVPWGKIILVGLAYVFVTQGLPNLLKK